MVDNISDEELLYIVGTTDRDLFNGGMDIGQRTWEVASVVMRRFGYESFVMAGVGKPAILTRIEDAMHSIYRPQDVAVGGHIGVFMYRDIFARISVPWISGRVGFNPFKFVDLTPVQLRIIQTEPAEMDAYLDQFNDVADVQYGIEEIKKPFRDLELVNRYANLSRLQLHAASAVLTGGYDYRGAVQSALLGTELALKAGVAARGLSEIEIKNAFGHDASKLAEAVGVGLPNFDVSRVVRVVTKQPNYVLNRYSEDQPPRRDVGHLVMGAQYVLSEVVRQMSDRNFRSGMSTPKARVYPA